MSATGMHASRRLDSQVKTQRLRAAVAALIAAGRPTTIAQVAREAGVSRKFIYSHPELRAEIEHRTLQAAAGTGSALVSDARVSAASLRADLENSRALVHRLRGQVAALERRLSESLGRQIAGELHDDEPTGAASVEVRERLERAEQRALELQEALASGRRNSQRCARSTASCSLRTTGPPAEPAGPAERSGGDGRRACGECLLDAPREAIDRLEAEHAFVTPDKRGAAPRSRRNRSGLGALAPGFARVSVRGRARS